MSVCNQIDEVVRRAQAAMQRWRARFAAGALVLLGSGAALALPAPPDNTIYGNVSTTLYTIVPTTGVATSVGTIAFATTGFARDPITGRIYYAESNATGRIGYWDPTTGTNTILPAALGFSTNRMGFRADGQMFSMNPGTNNIYVIDRETGNPTIVATVTGIPLSGGGDMAFAPNGDLYIVTGTNLYRVLQNPIAVPAIGAIPALATASIASGSATSLTGLTFINNGVALGTPTTGIVDLGINGGASNARGANGYSDLGSLPKFADIVISATPSSSNFPRNGSASYSIHVSNSGPQSASGNFTVSFTLPSGLTLVGAGPFGTGWSCAGTPVICTNTTPSLVVGASLPALTVPVTTAVGAGVNLVSTTFTAASTTFDPVTANATGTVQTSVGSATISKAFLADPIARSGVSTLVLTVSNPTASAFTGVAFTDVFPTVPGAMVVATPPNATTSGCGSPSFAPAGAAVSLSFSGGSIAAGANCIVRVDITAPTSGSYSNTASGVTTTETGASAGAVSNTATVLVMTPPTISKAFAAGPVIPNGPAATTITLSNPAANGANAITGASFTEVFPTTPGAMTLANTTISNGCGGTLSDAGGAALAAGSTGLRLIGGTIPSGGSCQVQFNVKAPTAGTYNAATGAVGSANAGSGAVSNTASLVVQNLVAPGIAKDFAPKPIAINGTSTLTFTITNPNPTTALTGVAFSDTFPTSPGLMQVAAVPTASTSGCGAPTFAPTAGAASILFSGGTIVASGTCTVRVNITLQSVGAYTNVSGAVSATGPSALTGNTATAVISTLAPPVVTKLFGPTTIGTGGVATVTIEISNPNGTQTITGVALTDLLPTTPGAMRVAATPAASVSGCGAPTFAPVANATSVAFSNGSIVGGGLCRIQFNVTAPTAGSYSNSTGNIGTADAGSGVSDSATLTLVATAPASISKSFLTSPMAANVPATLRIVIVNPNAATTLSGLAFTDTLPTSPGAMVVAATPAASTSGCGSPTFAPVAGATSLAFSGGSVVAGATCTVSVQVVAPSAGTYANSTSTVTSTSPVTSGVAALANVNVLAAPIMSKSFLTTPVAVGVPTTLRFNISNPNSLALSNLSFSDVFPTTPGAMVVAPVPNASTSAECSSPSFAPSAGATSVAFSTASIAAGATCRVSVDVVAPNVGSYANTSGAITSTSGGTGNTASATLTAVALNVPTISKTFASAGPLAAGVSNALTISLGNSNISAITLSSALVDNLPAGVTVASPANSSGSCVGVTATPGDNKITLASGANIPAGGCSIVANVAASAGGNYTNTLAAGALATSAGSNTTPTSASFSVTFAPVATKSFTPATVTVGASSVLKITLANPNPSTAITGVSFSDTYPGGLVNTILPVATITGTGCSGSVTGTAGAASLSLTGGVIPAGGSCDVTVNVSSASAASYLNSSGAISSSNTGIGNASSATLTVSVGAPKTVAKSFATAAVAPGVASVLRIRLTNPNLVAITGATFNDSYPSGLVNTATPAGSISGAGCTGSVTAAVNGTALALTAGNIPASSFCDITANVTGNTPGSYLNDSGTVATGNAGTAAASSATLIVLSPPALVKSFSPASVSVNSSSVLRIVISNANSATALAGVAFTDTYPAGLVNTATPAGAISGAGCSGSVTATAGGASLALSGATVPAGGSCDVTVNVTSAAAASYNNSSGAVTSSNAGSGAASIATLTVVSGPAPLTVAKTFTPTSIGTNDSTQLKISLLNPNASAVTGVAFTDTYPFAMVNAGAPSAAISGTGCSGSVTAAAGGSSLALSGATVPAGGSCDVTVNVTSNAANSYSNSTGIVTSSNAGNSTTVFGLLTVLNHMTVQKSFTPDTVTTNQASVLKITLANANAVALTGVAFTDSYPGGLVNTATPAGAIIGAGCSGTVSATANGSALALSGATVPASGSCDITVNVTSASAASYLNNSGAVASANAGSGASAAATLTVNSPALQAPVVAKSFTPAAVVTGENALLRVSISNSNGVAITGAAFSDNYPATLTNSASAAFDAASVLAGCSGTISGSNGGASLALSNGNIPAAASCVIEVNVSSNSPSAVLLTNPAFTVSTGNTPSANSAAANLLVLLRPTISKSFAPNSIVAGTSATLSLVINNSNPIGLSGLAFSDVFPGGLSVASVPNVSNSCGGSVSAAAGATSMALTAGTIAASQTCTVSVAVSSAAPGAYSNTSGGVGSTETGAAGPPSNAAVLTVNNTGVQIAGYVYHDTNHNLQRDAGEGGTGLALFSKLLAAASPAGPALQAVAVDGSTGAYQLAGVAAGEYIVVIDDNATLGDVTPTIPASWTGSENADQVRRNIVVAAVDQSNLNFGLFNGNLASGRVFRDNGNAGGTANNAVQESGEAGIAGVVLRLTNAAATLTYDSASSDASGNYRLWIPASLAGAALRVVEDNPPAHRSVGGSPALSYDRNSDSYSFTYALGTNPANLNFADVAQETLTSAQQHVTSAGDVVFYPHAFTPGSAGSVTFSAASSASWPQTLLRDTNCNGVVDIGETTLGAAVNVTAGAAVCLILKVNVPLGTAIGAQNLSTVQASFSYSNASPPLTVVLTNEDLTTVGNPGSTGLSLVKSQDNSAPLPSGRINYSINYANLGSGAITAIRISDSVPGFTRFFSAACVLPLASGITACNVTTSPAVGATGAIEWSLTGALQPGASGQVRFAVDVLP